MWRAFAAIVVVLGCGKGSEPKAAPPAAGSAAPAPSPPPSPPAPAPAPAPAGVDKGLNDLWTTYQAAHVGATPANAIETGRKILPLLDRGASDLVLTAAREQLAKLGATPISEQDLVCKMLGESAAVRAKVIASATPRFEQTGKHARIVISAALILDAEQDGTWQLAPGPNLLASETDVFKPAAGKEAPAGTATADALAARWKTVLDSGTGWDAYNLLSPAMRSKLLGMMAQMGGSGAGDVAKVFEKTIADRRDRGIHVSKARVEGLTADHGEVVVESSDGSTDRFTCVKVDGAWWLEFPF